MPLHFVFSSKARWTSWTNVILHIFMSFNNMSIQICNLRKLLSANTTNHRRHSPNRWCARMSMFGFFMFYQILFLGVRSCALIAKVSFSPVNLTNMSTKPVISTKNFVTHITFKSLFFTPNRSILWTIMPIKMFPPRKTFVTNLAFYTWSLIMDCLLMSTPTASSAKTFGTNLAIIMFTHLETRNDKIWLRREADFSTTPSNKTKPVGSFHKVRPRYIRDSRHLSL